MRPKRLVTVGLIVTGLAATVAAEAPAKPGGLLAKMQGSWQVVKTTENGREINGLKQPLTIRGNKMTGGGSASMFKLDESKSPAWIDVKTGDDPDRKGLVSVDGDTMRLAYEPSDDNRPAGFGSDKAFVIELVREGSATTRAGAATQSATMP